MLNLINKLLLLKKIDQRGFARLAYIASIGKIAAKKPYTLLSNIKYQIGDVFNRFNNLFY